MYETSAVHMPDKELVSTYSVLTDIKQLFSTRTLAIVARYAEQRYYEPISVKAMNMLSHKSTFLKLIRKYKE